MGSVDTTTMAQDILAAVGGEENIRSATHCATRLRLKLREEGKADKAAVEQVPGVIAVVLAGGQFQVVIGNKVPAVYRSLSSLIGDDKLGTGGGEGPKGNLLNQFIALISSIFLPVLWTLAGAGLFKAFVNMFIQFGWLDPESGTGIILNAASDSIVHFLPMFLAITAAKRFGTNQFTSLAVAGALVYPAIIALNETGSAVTFLGLPVVMMSYVSSVIPIIIAVWLQSHLERVLDKVLPEALRNFMTPLLVLLLLVPFVLMTVGPVTTLAAQGISTVVTMLFDAAPWLGGAIMGGFWQVFVLFGLHWGLVPVMINDLTTQGYSLLTGPVVPAVLAQAAAATAVMIRTRSAKRRKIAGPGAISGFAAGITEPVIYGVNLPLKTPFYFGIVGGAIGGAIAAAGGSAANAFVIPSLLALPAYMQVGNFTLLLIGTAVAVGIAFALTFVFGPRETPDVDPTSDAPPTLPEQADPDAAVAVTTTGSGVATGVVTTTGVLDVEAPMSGRTIELADVTDPVFSSGALGAGVGIVPSEGVVRAPVAGEVLTAAATGHAFGIRTEGGAEVLIHVGIDTVQLDGRHFEPAVKAGAHVRAGDVLGRVDLDAVAAAGYDTTTIVTVTNTAQLAEVLPAAPADVAAGDPVIAVQF